MKKFYRKFFLSKILRDVVGYSLEMAAEVVNLERNILIHGPDEDFTNVDSATFRQGFHFGTFGADASDDSVYDVRFARVQNCGQNNVMGRYCFHFHLKKQCPQCYLKGNAIVDSTQGAIVVHGSHQTNVEQNILWDSVSVKVFNLNLSF